MKNQKKLVNLAKVCRALSIFVFVVLVLKYINILFLSENYLSWLKPTSLAELLDVGQAAGMIAFIFFLLFIAELLENYNSRNSSRITNLLNLTSLFLGIYSGYNIVFELIEFASTFNSLRLDGFALMQHSLFQIISIAHNAVPILIALILNKLYDNYTRLVKFEEEVI